MKTVLWYDNDINIITCAANFKKIYTNRNQLKKF